MENINKNKKDLVYYSLIFIILSFIGGMIEYNTFYFDNMFCLMETGNLINIIDKLINYDIYFIYPLISLLTFIIASFIIGVIKRHIKNEDRYISASLLILIFISFINLFLIRKLDYKDIFFIKVISIILNTLFGVILVFIFPKFNNISFMPVMMSNNIRIVSSLIGKIDEENKIKRRSYLIVIISFILGIISSSLLIKFKDNIFPINSEIYLINHNIIFIFIFFLLIIVFYLYKKEKKLFIESVAL